jgi:hypothetical protein
MRCPLAVVALLVLTSCGGGDVIAPPNSGTLEVTTSTTGPDQDTDGYSIQIDGGTPRPIGVNDKLSLNLTAGVHSVLLTDVAAGCSVAGDNPQASSIVDGQTSAISFAIACGPGTATGTLEIRTTTSGTPDPDGYTVSVDGGAEQPIPASGSIDVPGLSAGAHTVTLSGLAANCAISGESSQPATVQAGATATVEFVIACSAMTLVWRPMQTGAIVGLLSIWGSSPTDLFAVGETAGASPLSSILHFDGQQWTPQYTSTDARLMGVWGSSPTNVFSVGFNGINAGGGGILLHSDGNEWTDMELPGEVFDQAYTSVWGSSGTDVFAVGESFDQDDVNLVAHFDGTKWTVVDLKRTIAGVASDVYSTSATDVYVVGNLFPDEGYYLLHYDGSTWAERDVAEPGVLTGVWASGPTDAFAVGQQHGALILHYDGQNWTPMMVPAGIRGLSDVWGSSPTDVYAVGDGILHYDGTQWTKVTDNHGVGVFGLSSTDIYVVSGTGVVLHGSP